MKISIALATFNGEKYLSAQLDSFVSQTRLPDEIVIFDDHSTDKTHEILCRFAEAAPFTVIVHRNDRNIGYIRNFEAAIGLCGGDIVMPADQDDVWLPNKIQTMIEYLGACPSVLVAYNDQFIVDQNLSGKGVTRLGNMQRLGTSYSNYVVGCCSSIRRQFLTLALPIPREARSHDGWIGALAEALSVKGIVEIPLQYYRRHGENVSASLSSEVREKSLLIRKLLGVCRSKKTPISEAVDQWRLVLERIVNLDQDVSFEISTEQHTKAVEYCETKIKAGTARLSYIDLNFSGRLNSLFDVADRDCYKGWNGLPRLIRDFIFA